VKGTGWFWPDQAFRDMIVCLVVFGVMVFLVMNGHGHPLQEHTEAGAAEAPALTEYDYWAKAGQRGLGANLDAPADASKSYEPRPEWYFLFLFQLLKYFKGEEELIGTVIIPGAVGLILFLLPLLGFGRMRPFGHIIGVVAVTALLTAVVSLTCLALAADTPQEMPHALLTRLAWVVIPAVAGVLLLFLAFTGVLPQGGFRRVVGTLGIVVVGVLLAATGGLLYAALTDQLPGPAQEFMEKQIAERERATPKEAEAFKEEIDRAANFHAAVAKNTTEGARAVRLAAQGIPAAGAYLLLQRDPRTQFKSLFLKNCATCHSFGDNPKIIPDAEHLQPGEFQTAHETGFENAKFVASDLARFGTEEWIYQFLMDPGSQHFLGRSTGADGPNFTRMANWSKKEQRGRNSEELKKLKTDFRTIAAWLATHPEGAKAKLSPAYKLMSPDAYNCVRCHRFESVKGNAPDLTGYGSAAWLRKMLQAPNHPWLYGAENHMPVFRDTKRLGWDLEKAAYEVLLTEAGVIQKKEPARPAPEGDGKKGENAAKPAENPQLPYSDLSDIDREMLIRYLTGDERVVFGGDPISAPPIPAPPKKE
jgi:mono/diheme cytochrome c family protein